MRAIDPGGVPGEPTWQLPVGALLAATSPEAALATLTDPADAGDPAGEPTPDRIAAALAVLPPGPITAALIERCSPDDPSMSPLGRLRLIAATERHTARLQARQDQWLASFARPGVSASIDQLLNLVCDGRRGYTLPSADPDQLTATLADRPEWQAVLAEAAERAAATEVAAVLGISPLSAGNRIRQALLLVDEFPTTLEAQLAGRLDRYRARTITGTLTDLAPELRGDVEQQAITDSTQFAAGRFADHCEQLLLLADPDAAQHRADRALADRNVRRHRGADGMGRFTADLPADKVLLTSAVLDAAAHRIPADLRGGRSIDQLRADIFTGIFTDLAETGHTDFRYHIPHTPPAAPAAPVAAETTDNPPPDNAYPPTVSPPWSPCVALTVTIAASTLAGLDNDPARLAGHGWINADLARRLAESAGTIRLAINRQDTARQQSPPPGHSHAANPPPCAGNDEHRHCTNDATCGGTLDHGRAVYRPPAAVKDYVITRDRVCRHPGCSRPAERCDLDHRVAYREGGPTCPCNLDPLCRGHHRSKTFLGWTAIREPGNHLRWTTPHGYTSTDHPEPRPTGKAFTPADLAEALAQDPPPF